MLCVYLNGLDTKRKIAETMLRAEKDNLKAIFASLLVGMLLLDEKTMIVDANTVVAGMVLRDPCQVIGQRGGGGLGCIHSLEHEKGCGFAQACLECLLRKGILGVLKYGTSVHGVEIQPTLLINGQQQRPWLSVSAEPVILNGRKHVIVAVDNITDRKRTEERIIKLTHLQTELLKSGTARIPHQKYAVNEHLKSISAGAYDQRQSDFKHLAAPTLAIPVI